MMPARAGRGGRRAAGWLLPLSLLAAAAGCDGGGAVVREDPLAVEAASARVDDLVLHGPTAQRIASYQLTTERVERWFDAQERLDALAADDPSLGGVGRPGPGGGTGGERAIDGAVERLHDSPAAREAIEGAGLSVRDFVLTGLALHQALTAAGPAAPPALRRLAARNMRFVTSNAELLSRFRTQRPVYLAESDPEPDPMDSVGLYDPFADSVVQEMGGDTGLQGADTLTTDSVPAADSALWPSPPSPRPDSPTTPPVRDTARARADTLLPPRPVPTLPAIPPATPSPPATPPPR